MPRARRRKTLEGFLDQLVGEFETAVVGMLYQAVGFETEQPKVAKTKALTKASKNVKQTSKSKAAKETPVTRTVDAREIKYDLYQHKKDEEGEVIEAEWTEVV